MQCFSSFHIPAHKAVSKIGRQDEIVQVTSNITALLLVITGPKGEGSHANVCKGWRKKDVNK